MDLMEERVNYYNERLAQMAAFQDIDPSELSWLARDQAWADACAMYPWS